MDGVLSIFQGIANSDIVDQEIYLKAIREHQSFRLENSHGTDSVVVHMTSILSKPDTRYHGLYLLNKYLEQCPADVFEQKAVLWLTMTLKACNPKEANDVGSIVYIVLKTLAIKSLEVPDVSKAFLGNFLPKIYASLSSAVPIAYHSALQCVEACLRLYPGPSGQSRSVIEKFVLKFVDASDHNLVVWSGKCLHLLQQVRGGGVQGISHKAAWQSYHTQLLGSLHSILDLVFANCEETYEDPKETELLSLASLQLSDDPIRRTMQLSTRFNNLIQYLISALRDPFPVPKAIAPKKILNLILRGLSVTCSMLQRNRIFDNMALGALLPMMHKKLFELLEATILVLKSNLAMYHATILGFIIDTLKWTSSKKSTGQAKPYTSLRTAAYHALNLWCNTLKHGSKCEMIAEGIIEEINYDITPFENVFTLKVLSGGKKHMSKKARRQLHKAQNEQSNLAQTHSNPSDSQAKKQFFSDEGNQQLCISALQCLCSVFQSAGCFLNPVIVRTTHLKIVGICLSVSEDVPKPGHLYHHYGCRLGIYNVLQTIIFASHHLCPPPTQIAIKLLQIARIADENMLVRETCSMFLSKLEKVIHPQKESLVFPSNFREIRNAFQKFGKEWLLQGEDNNESEDEDDEKSSSDNEPETTPTEDTVVQTLDDKDTTTNVKVTTQSIDLTADNTQLKDSIQVDSSNDSVEFVPQEQSQQQNSLPQTNDVLVVTKSPEMNLDVDEDKDDDGVLKNVVTVKAIETPIELPNESGQTANVSDVDKEEDESSSAKRPRLENSVAISESPVPIDQRNNAEEETENDRNGTCFEEIAAAFVDELV